MMGCELGLNQELAGALVSERPKQAAGQNHAIALCISQTLVPNVQPVLIIVCTRNDQTTSMLKHIYVCTSEIMFYCAVLMVIDICIYIYIRGYCRAAAAVAAAVAVAFAAAVAVAVAVILTNI